MNCRFSVIIPVYNAENTIKRCVDSLLKQPHEDVEILLINDGSKDSSGEFCQQYAQEYACVRYFPKENGGVSTARNLGLDNATGEYVMFVDSDDYVTEDYWNIIEAHLEETAPDMLQFGFRDCGEATVDRNNGEYYADSGKAIAARINEAVRRYMFSALYSKVFLNEIIQKNRLRFNTELSIGEDQVFILAYAMHIHSLQSIKDTLYVAVLDNQESLTRKKRAYLVEQLREVNRNLYNTVENADFPNHIKKIYSGAVIWVYYRSVYSCCKELLKYDLSPKERREKIKAICGIYAADRIRPMGLKCFAIAVPVLLRMSLVIDILINRS